MKSRSGFVALALLVCFGGITLAASDVEVLQKNVNERGVTGVVIEKVKCLSDDLSADTTAIFECEMRVSYWDLAFRVDGQSVTMTSTKVLIKAGAGYERRRFIDLAQGIECKAGQVRGELDQYCHAKTKAEAEIRL